MDDLNTEHAGRFGRLRKEISGPINCTRLALMIKLSSQLILIKVNNTRGVTNIFLTTSLMALFNLCWGSLEGVMSRSRGIQCVQRLGMMPLRS